MAIIISVSNQKGGVGKTTTSSALGICLKKRGYRVLLIDFDPQGNLSFSVGADSETAATVYDMLKGEVKAQHAIWHTPIIDIIPSNILLSGIELEFTGVGREFLLKEALASIRTLYDFVVIDTPPALSILTVNAFTASNCVVVPLLSDIFSLQGLAQLFETVDQVKRYCNSSLFIAGILLTKFNPRAKLSNEIRGTAELIADDLKIPLFKTAIRTGVALSEAQSLQQDVLQYAPRNNAVHDYISFTDELLAGFNMKGGE